MRKTNKPAIKSDISVFNERLFFSKTLSGIGYVGRRPIKGRNTRTVYSLARSVAYTSSKAFGSFFLSFGLLTLFLHLIRYYFESQSTVPLSSLIVGAAIAIVAIPLLRSDKPVCIMLQETAILDFILFEFFSIKRMHKINHDDNTIPPVVALFLGFIPAAVGFIFSPGYVLLALVIALFVVVAFVSPEFALIFTLLSLPLVYFLPEPGVILALVSLLTFISFGRKVLLGKRVYNFEIYDLLMIFIAFFLLLGGLFIDSVSMKDTLIAIALVLGYFNVSNLIVNRRLADCAVHAVISSSVPVSILAVIEYIIEHPSTAFTPPAYSTPGVSSAFATPDALAAFLIVSSIFTFGFAVQKQRWYSSLSYFAVFILNVFVLSVTYIQWAWISVLISIPAFLIITSRRVPVDALLGLIIASNAVLFASPELLDSTAELLGISKVPSQSVAAYGESFLDFTQNIWLGLGMNVGGEYNFLLGVGLRMGIFVLIIFVLMIIIRHRHLSYYRPFIRNCGVEVISNMSSVSIFCLIVFGVWSSVISDTSMFYFFFAVFAIGTASLRAAKRENDERLGYYKDSRSIESSELDIGIVNKD